MPFLDRGGFFARAHARRSYIVTARIADAPPDGMFISAGSPTRSLRAHPFGDSELLLVGGEGHHVGSTAAQPERYQKLIEFANHFPFFKLLGIEMVDFGPRWSKTQIELRTELCNANGVMHGGVIATLIDSGITQAMLMTDEYQRVRDTKGSMTSVDLRVKYLRPVTAGYAHCEATITHLGRRIGHASAVVTNAEGKEIALGDSIIMITLGDTRE